MSGVESGGSGVWWRLRWSSCCVIAAAVLSSDGSDVLLFRGCSEEEQKRIDSVAEAAICPRRCSDRRDPAGDGETRGSPAQARCLLLLLL